MVSATKDMLVGDDHDTVNDDGKMDKVDSAAGKQTNNVSCSNSLKQNQTLNEISTFSNWRYLGQNSQANYAQKVQINYNLNDPEVETAARQFDADVSDDRGDVNSVNLLEHFRALKPTLLEHFRVLKSDQPTGAV